MTDSMFRDRKSRGRHKPRPPADRTPTASVALKEVGADVTLKTETTTSSQGTTADGDSIAIEAAAYRGGGQLVSDLKMQDSLDKILYELKLLRLYAQEEAGGRDLGVTIEELKNDDYK